MWGKAFYNTKSIYKLNEDDHRMETWHWGLCCPSSAHLVPSLGVLPNCWAPQCFSLEAEAWKSLETAEAPRTRSGGAGSGAGQPGRIPSWWLGVKVNVSPIKAAPERARPYTEPQKPLPGHLSWWEKEQSQQHSIIWMYQSTHCTL